MDVAGQAGFTAENWRAHYAEVKRRIYTPTRPQESPAPVTICAPEPPRIRIKRPPSEAFLKMQRQRREASHLLDSAVLAAHGRDLSGPIIRETAEYFGFKSTMLTSALRFRRPVMARFVAIYLCKTRTSLVLSQIGHKFGGRDHTSVLHSIRTVQKHIGSGDEFDVAVREISERLDARRVAGVEGRQEVGGDRS